MLKKAAILLCIALGITANACFAEAVFKSKDEFARWMTFYYQNPEPAKISGAIEYFSDSSLYQPKAALPAVVFFSSLLKQDAMLMAKVFNEISATGSERAKSMMINTLFFSNTLESRSVIEEARRNWKSERIQVIITRLQGKTQRALDKRPVDSPQMLDMLWASFFATGDVVSVQRIVSVIHLAKDGHGEKMILGAAANWSLGSNAKQHPKVLEICRSEAVKATGITRELLTKIIKTAATA